MCCNARLSPTPVIAEFISLNKTLYPIYKQIKLKRLNPGKPAKYWLFFHISKQCIDFPNSCLMW